MQARYVVRVRATRTRRTVAHIGPATPSPHRGERHAGGDELVAQIVQVQRAARRAGRGVAGRAAARGSPQVSAQPAQVTLLACRRTALASAGGRAGLCRYSSSNHST